MAATRSEQKSAVRKKLEELAEHLSLREPGLVDDLGSGFRRLWGIDVEVDPAHVFEVVSGKFGAFIKGLGRHGFTSAEDVQATARVHYNLYPYAPLWEMKTLTERRKWLAEHQDDKNWRGQSVKKPHVAFGTQRDKMREHILPLLEKRVLAEWQQFAPDEPFPGDPEPPDNPPAGDWPTNDEDPTASGAPPRRRLRTRFVLASLAGIVLLTIGSIYVPRLIGGAVDDSPQVGDALRFTPLYMYGNPSSSYVFDAQSREAAATFAQVQIGEIERDYDAFANRALDSGAYFYGGIEVTVSVEGLKDGEATIYDVQVQKRDVQPIASDTVFHTPVGGRGPIIGMQFDLDQQHPIAMEIPEPSKVPRPLFDVLHPGLAKNQKASLVIRASARTAAYAFDFEIFYEYGGKKYRQNISRNGRPFKVSAPLCPGLVNKLGVPDETKQRLVTQRYREVYRATQPPARGAVWYSAGPAGPDKFAESCENSE